MLLCFFNSSESEMKDWFNDNGHTFNANPGPGPLASINADLESKLEVLTTTLNKLSQAKMDLETCLQSIEQGASTGKVCVGDFSFDSELEIVELLKEEGINPKRLAIAVDCNSLFAHHLSGEAKVDDTSTEFKNLKSAGMGDNTCIKYLTSFWQIHPNIFLDSKNTPIKEGARFPMLENKKAWKGSSTTIRVVSKCPIRQCLISLSWPLPTSTSSTCRKPPKSDSCAKICCSARLLGSLLCCLTSGLNWTKCSSMASRKTKLTLLFQTRSMSSTVYFGTNV